MPLPLLSSIPGLSGLFGGGGSQSTASNSLNFSSNLSPSITVAVLGQGGADTNSDLDGQARSDAAASLTTSTAPTSSGLSGLGSFSSFDGIDAGTFATAAPSSGLFGSPLVIAGGVAAIAALYFITKK